MNVASRLVSLAKPNEIIISDATYDRVSSRINAESLPPVHVKGKSGELNVYRVLGHLADWGAETTKT
jgi:adenylate cyclase